MSKKKGKPADEEVVDVNRLMQQRQQKVATLREAGVNPYSNGYAPTHTAGEVLAIFADAEPPEEPSREPQPLSEERFAVAGRAVEFRSFGKAAFIKLADRSDKIQVYVRRDVVGEEAYKIFKKAESWDFLGATGFAFFTRTGELTIMAEQVRLLTKTVRPPPAKWSGLKDRETRYRQRYVDLVANADVAQVFRQRCEIIKFIRAFLDELGFLEVETPMLHPVVGGAAARPFETHHNALDMELKLRIAPELYLKRLLVGGYDRVYEIGRTFRNEGLSRRHNPEFSMCEFYMAYATYDTLMDLTEQLLVQLTEKVCGGLKISWEGQAIDMSPPWPRITVREAVVRACAEIDVEPELTLEMLDDAEATSQWLESSGLLARENELGKMLRATESHGKRVGALFDQLGEQHLPLDRPVFVVDYPAATSPLSRRKDDQPELVDRFELFIMQREIANAFSELNDPEDQRGRFKDQIAARAEGDKEAMEYDEDYCRALEYGMPPAAGEGIGIDRLVMLLCDQPSIRDVILFPHMRPEAP